MSAAPRDREFAFDAADHQAIARLAYDEAGIVLSAAKAQLVYGRLARRVRACGLAGFGPYIALLERDADERVRAIDALTTNHTSFFRENHHFEHFAASCWPALAARLSSGGAVRLWSAACSSGEEPYSLAMTLCGRDRSAAGALGRRDLRILATDLSTDILVAARAGRYSRDTVQTVPGDLRGTWFGRVGTEAEVVADLRALIAFRHLNLLGDWPIRGQFDAIFCRNVMIYFDKPTQGQVLSRFEPLMKPGALLFAGHSENFTYVTQAFRLRGQTVYELTRDASRNAQASKHALAGVPA